VYAIDIESSGYKDERIWDIVDYNGTTIPFEDKKFDVVFSSNVLEHIPHVKEFQKEIERVLKDDGIAIHLMPTETWRFWTILTHYIYIFLFLFKIIFSKLLKSNAKTNNNAKKIQNISKKELLQKVLIAQRHGEQGNIISEIYYFSKSYWNRLFSLTKWKIVDYKTNGIYYSGYFVGAKYFNIKTRKVLSKTFGSSCHFYILEKDIYENS
jgi:2-polyprenyl-3-methyl-5-hydroxy-6-metoxy-1,4-benzoquinol methylase